MYIAEPQAAFEWLNDQYGILPPTTLKKEIQARTLYTSLKINNHIYALYSPLLTLPQDQRAVAHILSRADVGGDSSCSCTWQSHVLGEAVAKNSRSKQDPQMDLTYVRVCLYAYTHVQTNVYVHCNAYTCLHMYMCHIYIISRLIINRFI